MYGFVLHIGNKANLNKDTEKLKGGKKINYRNFFCRYNPMPKFEDDKLFLETPELIILLDGVIYNKKELLHRFNENEWGGVFIKLCESSEKFMDELRGPFRGFVYDKKKESLTCFTNHSGEKTIYYYADSDGIVIATHNDLIAEYLKTNGKPCLWNRDTAVELMTVGYALDDHTPMRDVYRLTAGKALRYEVNSQKTDVRRYHFLKNLPEWSMPEEEAMSRFDALYRQAVNRIFSKNEEYGYRHEADLSGGLDTRMVNWVAHDLGYRNFININYCQPGGIDQITASEICEDLGNEFVYYSMEDGEFLKDIDEMTGIYGGQVVYFISTGANRSYARVKEKNIGMAATGLVGEMCNAYWRQGNQHTPPDICVNRMSDILNEPLKASSIQEFDNYEHCNQYLYSYGLFLFSGVIRNQWCEFATPYVDKDFAEFAFRLPLEWRMDYRFYTKWIKTYYPESAKYVWQTKMRPVNRTVYFPRIGWAFQKFGKRIVNKLCRGLNIGFQFTFKDDMNPFNTWYANNGSLRSFMTDYFEDNIGLIADPEIKEKVSKIFAGQGNDKMVALNILAINKRYFRGNDYEEGA